MNRVDRARARIRLWVRAPIGYAKRQSEKLRRPHPHELAVCAIFREEAPFLDEWIAFHAGVGVTHFYLYNNFSTDDFWTVLEPWIARGLVTLTEWPVKVGQVAAYRHCLRRARDECRWLAFIDIDEFLFAPQVIDVRSILRRYSDLPAVDVWQLFFGSGGHAARPTMPVTEAYLKRAPLSQISVKSIANPRMIYKPGIHRSKYWLGDSLDTSRHHVEKDRKPVFDVLRINHYWSRSIEDLETKIRRTDASTPQTRDPVWHFNFEKSLNAETDDTILPIARTIRAARESDTVRSGR
jgi:hypothetical protein